MFLQLDPWDKYHKLLVTPMGSISPFKVGNKQ